MSGLTVVHGLREDATALVEIGEHLFFSHLEIAEQVCEPAVWAGGPFLAA